MACDGCKSFIRGAIIAATPQLADSCEAEQDGATFRFCEIHSLPATTRESLFHIRSRSAIRANVVHPGWKESNGV